MGNCLLDLCGGNNGVRVQHWPTYMGFTDQINLTIGIFILFKFMETYILKLEK